LEVIKTSTKKGECVIRFKNKIMLMKWQDKREVYLLSMIHDDNIIELEKRKIIKNKPEVVVDYDKENGWSGHE